MKNIIYIVVCCVFILSCNSSHEPEKPKNLIPEDKMVDVLVDLSIISSAKGVNKKVLENNGITPDEYVYNRHQIDSTQFSESNTYYSFFIDDYKKILKRVDDSLYNLKKKHNRLIEKDIKKPQLSDKEKKVKSKAKRKRDSLVSAPKE